MIAFFKYNVGFRQYWIVFEIAVFRVGLLQFRILLNVELLEVFKVHLERLAQFDSYLLLLLENDLVVLHIFLGVGLQVRPQFVQVQAVLVRALLSTQEELAELGSSERGTNQPVVIHELVHGQYGLRAVSRVAERDVPRVRGTAAASIIHIVGVDDDLLYFSVLPKEVERAYFRLRCNVRRQSDHIHERLLDHAQIRQLSDLVLRQRADGYARLAGARRRVAEGLH